MPKRQTGWTEANISRYIKEGRGQGELALYLPWLTIQDVPSRGRVHRFIGWKTAREHHLFSDLEFNYHCFKNYFTIQLLNFATRINMNLFQLKKHNYHIHI